MMCTGELTSVAGSAFDFHTAALLGERIPRVFGAPGVHGFDHTYCLPPSTAGGDMGELIVHCLCVCHSVFLSVLSMKSLESKGLTICDCRTVGNCNCFPPCALSHCSMFSVSVHLLLALICIKQIKWLFNQNVFLFITFHNDNIM